MGASNRYFDVTLECIQNLGKDLVNDVGVTSFDRELERLIVLLGLKEIRDLLLY